MVDDFLQDDGFRDGNIRDNGDCWDDGQALARQLDRAVPPASGPTGDSPPPDAGDGDSLVAVACRVARGPHPALTEVALDRIEDQLRSRYAALYARSGAHSGADAGANPGPRAPVGRRWGRSRWQVIGHRLRHVAAVLVVLLLFSGSLSVVSAHSLPGDDLYPVKTIIEELQLILVSSDREPGLRVRLAERRLDEFEQLIRERETVRPDVLMEASAQLNRALTLLAAGHGNRTELDPRIANTSYRQATLIQYAASLAPPEIYDNLILIADWNNLLIGRVLGEGTLDYHGSVVSSVHRISLSSPRGETLPPISTPTSTPEPDATPDEQSRIPALVLCVAAG